MMTCIMEEVTKTEHKHNLPKEPARAMPTIPPPTIATSYWPTLPYWDIEANQSKFKFEMGILRGFTHSRLKMWPRKFDIKYANPKRSRFFRYKITD